MNPRRVAVLLGKEFVHGSRGFFFIFAVAAPLTLSLVVSLVFGTLFSEKPKLGVTAEGNSQVAQRVTELDSVVGKTYPSTSALIEAVRAGAVDMGIVLPQGFDSALAQGQVTEISAYIWGESLAKNRVILGAIVADLVVELAGHEVPLEIVTTALGEAEDIPWNDRLLPLMVLMTVFMAGSMIPASSLVNEKQKHTLTALTTTPTTLEEVYLTKGLVGIIMSLLTGLLILTMNQALGSRPQLLLLVLSLGAVLAAGFGILLGALTRDITSLFATFKSIGIFLYAPALVYLFPQAPQWIGKVFPTYYVVQPVIEISQQGGTWSDVAFEVLVLVGLIVVLMGVVGVVARRARQAA
jgi:ABC-2 type transport system permease protein